VVSSTGAGAVVVGAGAALVDALVMAVAAPASLDEQALAASEVASDDCGCRDAMVAGCV